MAVAAGSVYSRGCTSRKPHPVRRERCGPRNLRSRADAGCRARSHVRARRHRRSPPSSGSGLGTSAWDFTGDGSLVTAPLVVGGLVFVGSSSGELYALDAATGASSWSTNVGSAIPAPNEYNLFERTSGLGAANGTLIVPAAGNKLVAYRTDGAITTAPANLAAPTIDGTPRAGDVLGADVGIWSRLPSSYAYQWQRCDGAGASCSDIPSATAPTYKPRRPTSARRCACASPATNGAGTSAPVTSGSSAAVLPAPPDPGRAFDQRHDARGRHADRRPRQLEREPDGLRLPVAALLHAAVRWVRRHRRGDRLDLPAHRRRSSAATCGSGWPQPTAAANPSPSTRRPPPPSAARSRSTRRRPTSPGISSRASR